MKVIGLKLKSQEEQDNVPVGQYSYWYNGEDENNEHKCVDLEKNPWEKIDHSETNIVEQDLQENDEEVVNAKKVELEI